MDNDLEQLKEDVHHMATNCIPTINKNIAKLEVNLSWLLKFFWIVTTASLAALVAGIMGLLLK